MSSTPTPSSRARPEWVLVDELAHTNVPGTVHAKRWQSIEEIRDAGINVITTVNVQHLESLNDTVFEITGVRVRETVPDWVVDQADEVELVDLTAGAVINRLKRGDIYTRDKIPRRSRTSSRRTTSSPCVSSRSARRRRTSTSTSSG